MAKSSTSFASPDGKVETRRRAGKPKGARRRASPRSVTKADAATRPVGEQRGERPEAVGEATQPVAREAAAAAPCAPAAPEAPPHRAPTEDRAATEEHAAPAPPPTPPSSSTEIPVAAARAEPGSVASAAPPARAAISGSGGLVEGTMRLHGELLAFGWRQTEQGLAVGRAMLASRSLPEILALQSAWLGNAFGAALSHGLELSRLAGDMMRSGLPGR